MLSQPSLKEELESYKLLYFYHKNLYCKITAATTASNSDSMMLQLEVYYWVDIFNLL